ncbi:YdcF family protein [Anaeromyxobacter diazotrophicus]|uniref:DUF218 domain-containing protein n=1 Tax=Anaeromyxobacter diazotrophicus TaxID=2590199 RepID=A0A7I9VP39_9BACT|nr:YdcF family protein [Anaeromyxobacter diazotrophicus]GEJ58175.1 hypothetical protein AMYX_29160 [Anaeromyxobacter diazotrophicus]
MFLTLSKLLDLLVAPLTWALALALGAALARARPARARALAAAGAAVLYLFSIEPVATLLMAAVEAPARSTYRPEVVYDAVVVLSGEVDAAAARRSGRLELTEGADRLVAAYELLRGGRARAALLSGGSAFPVPGERSEAELVAATLRGWGIAPDRLVVEGASRNTRENAVEAARVAGARGWRSLLLVTSAFHLPRALGCFRRVGLSPDALPVDARAGDGRRRSWLPRASALGQSTEALREWTGRLVYWAMGYTA